MLKTSTTRSAKNSSVSGTWLRLLKLEAEQASQPDQPRIRRWTWLRMLRLMPMVMVVMMKRWKNYLPRSWTGLWDILFPYSPKRWVSSDSFWLLLRLPVKGTIWKAAKQSFCQVRETYELSQCHVTSIIKLQSLGTNTPFSGTSSLSLTSPYKCLSGNTQSYGHLAY